MASHEQPTPNPQELRGRVKEKLEVSSIELLDVTYDIFDTLTLPLNEQIPAEERAKLELINEGIQTFVNSEFILITPRPRQERATDRTVFLPGQHKGIFIQFVTESGDIGMLNMYGGLRDTAGTTETKDGDISMRRHHTHRTERILSQPMHINLHLKDRTNEKTEIDTWLKYQLNRKFELVKIIIDGNNLDLFSQIDSANPHFAELSSRLHKCSDTLTTLIPSV